MMFYFRPSWTARTRKKSQFLKFWIGPLGTKFKNFGIDEPQMKDIGICLVQIGTELDTGMREVGIKR